MKYELFFFKENTRNIDIDSLFKYFNSNPYTNVSYGDQEVLITYRNDSIALDAEFHITRSTRVKDIYRLNPRFLDIDLFLSFDIMIPMYSLNILIDFVEELCARFQFFIYNSLFEDVSSFKRELITGSFDLYRKKYKDMYKAEYSAQNYMKQEVLTDVLKYLNERKSLETYFKEDEFYFPIPRFMKSKTNNRTYVTVDFKENTLFVFPPRTDIVIAQINGSIYLVYYDELLSVINKYTTNIPGFVQSTRVLTKQGMKKIGHIISHEDFTKINDEFEFVDTESLVDF